MTNDDILVSIFIRGGIASLLALGGIAALLLGYILLRRGHGSVQGETDIAVGRMRISATSAGFLIMATSAAWGYLSANMVPAIDPARDSDAMVQKMDSLEKSLQAAENKQILVLDSLDDSLRTAMAATGTLQAVAHTLAGLQEKSRTETLPKVASVDTVKTGTAASPKSISTRKSSKQSAQPKTKAKRKPKGKK
jgi:hypothetical protein